MKSVLLGFVLTVASSTGTTLSVLPSSTTISTGASIVVEVEIRSVADLYAFQFDLLFEPTVFAVSNGSDIVNGTFLNDEGFVPGFIDNVTGSITFVANSVFGSKPGISGSGPLARVTFTSVGTGSSLIAISNFILLDSHLMDISAQTISSEVTAIPEPGTILLLSAGGIAVGLIYLARRRLHLATAMKLLSQSD